MAPEGKGVAAAAVLAVLVIAISCGRDDEPATSNSLTIASVETFADVTLSDGRRVHNTLVDSVASTVVSSSYGYSSAADQAEKSCITGALNRWAVDNLVGRPVGDIREDNYSSYSEVSPMAGYERARVYFVSGSSESYDITSDLRNVRMNAYDQCSSSAYSTPTSTTTTPAPTTTTEAPVYADTDPDAYVDADAPSYDAPKRRTGNSGHPCLPGERDGDGDGYCGEGR